MKTWLGSTLSMGIMMTMFGCGGDVQSLDQPGGLEATGGAAGSGGFVGTGGNSSGGNPGAGGVTASGGSPGRGGSSGRGGGFPGGSGGQAGAAAAAGAAGTGGAGPQCGNGITEPPEQCDDGNALGGDGCSELCQIESSSPDMCPGQSISLSGTGTQPRVGTTSGSTASLAANYEGSCTSKSGAAGDAVYHVTADVSGTLRINLGGESATPFDSVLYVRQSCENTGTEIDCDDAWDPGADEVEIGVIAGQTYFVFVDGYDGEEGNFSVVATLIPSVCGNGTVDSGEECDDGNVVGGDGCSAGCALETAGSEDQCNGVQLALAQNGSHYVANKTGTTINLAQDYEGTCGGSSARDGVYWFHTPTAGVATVTTNPTGTTYDSLIYVRAGSCGGAEIECDDGYGDGGESLTFEANADTDYFIFIDGFSDEAGAYQLDVTFTPSVCGNQVVEPGEECDDGNASTGDGCSSSCEYESSCGGIAEVEPNTHAAPQVVPPACGSFRIMTATLPQGDTDYYRVALPANTTIVAETFRSSPGYCDHDTDTVLSLWRAPVPTGGELSGSCNADPGWLACNDTDSDNSPCSKLTYTVPGGGGGNYVLKVYNYFSFDSIATYGLMIQVR